MPAILIPALRSTLLRPSRGMALQNCLLRGMRVPACFTKALRIRFQGIEISIDVDPESGLADCSDLDAILTDLILTSGNPPVCAPSRSCHSLTNCEMFRKTNSLH